MTAKILVAEDDQEILELIKFTLTSEHYHVIWAEDGETAYKLAVSENPDLVMLDVNMPKLSGFEVCEKIRENPSTSLTPIIILTSLSKTKDRITGIKLGADEYMTKPFEPVELVVRVEGLLRRTRETLGANPLTKLPGAPTVEAEIKKRMESDAAFAVAYADVDGFKSYNDKYGFDKGDGVIKLISLIIRNAVSESGAQDGFVGHLGGEDFVVISEGNKIGSICQYIAKSFEKLIPEQYDDDARARGFLWGVDRIGKQLKFPIMTVSVGAVKVQPGMYRHYSEIVEQAKFLLKKAKQTKGNSCEIS
jgi:PleD family two-component response regulator